MASQINNYQCPACTGPLHFVGSSGQLECDYCGSKYSVQEIEARYAEAERRAQEAMAAEEAARKEKKQKAAEQAAKTENDGTDAQEWEDTPEADAPWEFEYNGAEWTDPGMKAYGCPSCGAELICEETTAATSCPYCGNPTVIPGKFAGELRPDLVIPFKLDKKEAVARLKKHYKGILLPKQFASQNHLEEVKGVYVPFWLYDGTASGKMTFKATRSRVRTTSRERITTTDHFLVEREGSMRFEQVPIDASSKMPDDYMESIEPFDYSELTEFSTAYLPGFLADKYDVEQKACDARVAERCRQSMIDTLTASAQGYTTCIPVSTHTQLRQGEVKYALLPVWLLSTQWKGKNFLFAMNGQTGKMVGDLPISGKRLAAFCGGIFAAVFLLTFLFFL